MRMCWKAQNARTGRGLLHYQFNVPILQMGKLRRGRQLTEAYLRGGKITGEVWSWMFTRISTPEGQALVRLLYPQRSSAFKILNKYLLGEETRSSTS